MLFDTADVDVSYLSEVKPKKFFISWVMLKLSPPPFPEGALVPAELTVGVEPVSGFK